MNLSTQRSTAHHRRLPEAAFPVRDQQLDLVGPLLVGAHQHQILIPGAGDVLDQVLVVGLRQDGLDPALRIGVHRQIADLLGGVVAHHDLVGAPSCRRAKRTVSTVSVRPSTASLHLPYALGVLLEHRQTDVGGVGRGIEHRGVLLAVPVKVAHQKGGQQLPVHGIFQLGALLQPLVQSGLDLAVVPFQPGRARSSSSTPARSVPGRAHPASSAAAHTGRRPAVSAASSLSPLANQAIQYEYIMPFSQRQRRNGVLGCIIPSKCDDFYNKVPPPPSKEAIPRRGWLVHT